MRTIQTTLLLGCLFASTAFVASTQGALESPRLLALDQALSRSDGTALGEFWAAVARDGAPLVETVSEDGRYTLVTFVWRGALDTRNVVVTEHLGQLGGTRLVDNQMSRLRETDVWYRSYWLPSDARTIYRLGPNDSLEPTGALAGEALRARTAAWQLDPLNPKQWTRPRDPYTGTGRGEIYSLLELPNAPDRPWIVERPDTPKGQVVLREWASTLLSNRRQIWVYTPPGYNTDGDPYALVLTTDGFGYVNAMGVTTILDNLIAAGRIPPTVAVFVGNSPGAARRELACHDPFIDFLTTEIMPWVRSTYHVTRAPSNSVIAGFSLGGLTASCVALSHSNLFGNVLSQSGSYWWKPSGDDEGEWLTRRYASMPKLPLRFHLVIGTLEMGNNAGSTPRWVTGENIPYGPSMLVVNRHFRDVLTAKGYWVDYSEVGGAHNAVNGQSTFADGLIALLGPK